MDIIWNQIDIQRPPSRQWKLSAKAFNFQKFVDCFDKITEDFNDKVLKVESVLLSRMIYRMKQKFRNDKGLKYMGKVNKVLLICLRSSIKEDYKFIQNFVEIENGDVILPSKQMVQYILVKTQGFAKLLTRVEETARISANFFKIRIGLGHAWSVAIIAYAVLSRIWMLSRHIIKKMCIWYENIYSYCNHMKSVGLPWLPDNYILPVNLRTWLNISWCDEELESLPEMKDQTSIFNLIDTNMDIDTNEDMLNTSCINEIIDIPAAISRKKQKTTADRIPVIQIDNTEITEDSPAKEEKEKPQAPKSQLSMLFCDDENDEIGELIVRNSNEHNMKVKHKIKLKNKLPTPKSKKNIANTEASIPCNGFKSKKKKKHKVH